MPRKGNSCYGRNTYPSVSSNKDSEQNKLQGGARRTRAGNLPSVANGLEVGMGSLLGHGKRGAVSRPDSGLRPAPVRAARTDEEEVAKVVQGGLLASE